MKDDVFRVRGGPRNLIELIALFAAFVESPVRVSPQTLLAHEHHDDHRTVMERALQAECSQSDGRGSKMEPARSLEWLMAWYEAECDGDWERQRGIRIQTLDNPGWSVDVNLAHTEHAGRTLSGVLEERAEHDWSIAEVKDGAFRAYGGPGNLAELLARFAAFVESRDDAGALAPPAHS